MKRTLLALGAVLGLSGAAAAADITYFGTAEYRTDAKLTAAYDLNENFTAFVRLEADSDFKRQETTLGVALEF